MIVFLAKRVKKAQQMFDDIQVGDPDDKQAREDEHTGQ
jgi:hypothetical protein